MIREPVVKIMQTLSRMRKCNGNLWNCAGNIEKQAW